jgi:dTDP-4-amino-4,6-dideoxygalactose transaminase
MPGPLSMQDVSVSGNNVKVTGAGAQALGNSLLQKHSVTIAELSDELGFVDPQKLSMGADGSITINSPAVAAKITQLKAAGVAAALDNLNCNC